MFSVLSDMKIHVSKKRTIVMNKVIAEVLNIRVFLP